MISKGKWGWGMNRNLRLGSALGLFILSGCGGKIVLNQGEQRIIERIPNKEPDWKLKVDWDDDKAGVLYFTGAVTGRSDMALGIEEARAEAEKKLAYRISEKVYASFGKATEGQNVDDQLGQYVKSVIAKTSENVKVSGVALKDQYVERVMEGTGYGNKTSHNCYVLLTLAKPDYLEAKRKALEGAVEKAKAEKNQKAEDSLKEAFKKLDETN